MHEQSPISFEVRSKPHGTGRELRGSCAWFAVQVQWMGAWSAATVPAAGESAHPVQAAASAASAASAFQLAWEATEEERCITLGIEAGVGVGKARPCCPDRPCARTPSEVERLAFGQAGDPKWVRVRSGQGRLARGGSATSPDLAGLRTGEAE